MATWVVSLEERVRYTIEVEADSEEEASAMAQGEWEQSLDPTHDFEGDGQGVTVRMIHRKPLPL